VATWLIDAINLVTGNFDRAGGAMFTTPAVDLAAIARLVRETGHFDRWRSRVGDLPEFNGELPVGALADEISTEGPGQIRALITVAGNPVLSNPNGRRLDRALDGLEFVACVDFYLNETTRHADVILPPAAPFETSHYPMLELALGVRNTASYATPVVDVEPNARHDSQILLELVSRLALARGGVVGRLIPFGVRAFSHALSSGLVLDALLRFGPHRLRLRDLEARVHGIDLGPLEPRAAEVVATDDAMIDLVPAPLEADIARLESELAAAPDDDLLLISRRTLRSMNSWLHNMPLLVRGKNRCTLLMNPRDARDRALTDGMSVRVTGRVGAIEVELAVSDEMMPGVVCLPYGWGHDREGSRLSVAVAHPGSSMNDIVDERVVDAVSGTAVLDGVPVAVAAA
jgi:anaerobic selenocysteine-containing dehydrogenase